MNEPVCKGHEQGAEFCPLLHKCVKFRLEPDEVIKLEALVNSWEKNKKTMDFFSSVGRIVLKFRKAANG